MNKEELKTILRRIVGDVLAYKYVDINKEYETIKALMQPKEKVYESLFNQDGDCVHHHPSYDNHGLGGLGEDVSACPLKDLLLETDNECGPSCSQYTKPTPQTNLGSRVDSIILEHYQDMDHHDFKVALLATIKAAGLMNPADIEQTIIDVFASLPVMYNKDEKLDPAWVEEATKQDIFRALIDKTQGDK